MEKRECNMFTGNWGNKGAGTAVKEGDCKKEIELKRGR